MPAIRGSESKKKTRRYTRDIDQAYSDLHDPNHLRLYKDTKAVEDLPGLGQHYCTECAKWFESEPNFLSHIKGKPHKKRVRQLREKPYGHKEADAAAGLFVDNGKGVEMLEDPKSTEMDVA
ncbi:zinc finger-containing protein [Eremomyces bilateralis CBS 781.70]|uniref:Zinc finger-containing protein n=1 Tax=Eremomyces bilateralis CBS 781.70 TaxID=1392243 RepID=A0A6G1FS48_9PEZI|nr:zinc finger-containing protein [Eremomyces bilateralis CBS 781.70]KAF1808492.1 zinc finger-containing protein [Eremomyces bilateralis CBS 781.70]